MDTPFSHLHPMRSFVAQLNRNDSGKNLQEGQKAKKPGGQLEKWKKTEIRKTTNPAKCLKKQGKKQSLI